MVMGFLDSAKTYEKQGRKKKKHLRSYSPPKEESLLVDCISAQMKAKIKGKQQLQMTVQLGSINIPASKDGIGHLQ